MFLKIGKAFLVICSIIFACFTFWIIRRVTIDGFHSLSLFELMSALAAWFLLIFSFLQYIQTNKTDYVKYIDKKRQEWQSEILSKAKSYINNPKKQLLIEKIKDDYFKSKDYERIMATMDDYRELRDSLKEINNFFINIQKDLIFFYKKDAKIKKLINVYFGNDIIEFYNKIGFYHLAAIKWWEIKGIKEKAYFRMLYDEIKNDKTED